MQYSKTFTDALEFVWGEGFLSPGGPEDVALLLGEVRLLNKNVLDIGSGLGGVDILLVRAHGAAKVTGIDVEKQLVEAATARAAAEGVAHKITYRLVEPGLLPFGASSFDVVFSKDSIVHIPDKGELFRDVWRVLKKEGAFIASDWLFCEGAETHPALINWLLITGLHFVCMTPEEAMAELERAGFRDITVDDRNAELSRSNRAEVEMLSGPARQQLAAVVGADMAEKRLQSAQRRQEVLDLGVLRPCHLRARKKSD